MPYKIFLPVLLFTLFLGFNSCKQKPNHFQTKWPVNITRHWIGSHFWSNRLQDWRINNGRLECINNTQPYRAVHLLTHSLSDTTGHFHTSVHLGSIADSLDPDQNDFAGFLIGAGTMDQDYRQRALIFKKPLQHGGYLVGINGNGTIVIDNNHRKGQPIEDSIIIDKNFNTFSSVKLEAKIKHEQNQYNLYVSIKDRAKQNLFKKAVVKDIPAHRIPGNVALVAHLQNRIAAPSFWFDNWEVSGNKLQVNASHQYGPVYASQYTLSQGTLKMTAQFAPLDHSANKTAILKVSPADSNNWKEVAQAKIKQPGWTATFTCDNWNDEQKYDYKIVYALKGGKGDIQTHYYEGVIQKNPKKEDEVNVAAFTGNSNGSLNDLWFPHEDLIKHVAQHDPDLLVYTGDQVYESHPTPPDWSSWENTKLDYLYKWYLWCWSHGELARKRPCICIPDDHDVYHGNIWGCKGKKAPLHPKTGKYPDYYEGYEYYWSQDQGGYKLPPRLVNMVQRTQTAHLPDPYNPQPVKQDINVYYTNMNYGRISFAILEDRKFKSAPTPLIPEAKIINGFPQVEDFPVNKLDHPEAKLLGKRQLQFLEDWAGNWKGIDMKASISQSIFACLSTYPDSFKTDADTRKLDPLPRGTIPKDYKKAIDMDSHGWPQSKRDKALKKLRKGFAFMIAGDQHLGSIVHHGVNNWNDAGYSFCVPSIANLWPRRWFPPHKGKDHREGMPPYTGKYKDGFNNYITVWAASNPYKAHKEPAKLHNRAPGYGIITFHKPSREITMECWPRYAKPETSDQYPGWPKTIEVMENYGKKPVAYLPELKTNGLERPPVIKIIREKNKKLVYAIRPQSNNFRPKVFQNGYYNIKIGEPGTEKMKSFYHIQAINKNNPKSITINF